MKLYTLIIIHFCTVLAGAEDSNKTTSQLVDLLPTTLQSLPPSPQSRIVGGSNATAEQFPHQIAVFINRRFTCGGSIIQSNYVLTAAHCVVTGNPPRPLAVSVVTVRAGSLSLFSGGQLVGVSSVRAHPRYGNFLNDIAVLKLSESLQLNNLVKPIALASQAPPSGAPTVTSGWGRISNDGPVPQTLQYIVLSALSYAECRQRISLAHPTVLCLSHLPGNGVCFGDSGGPAVYQNRLVGVTNFIVGGCASGNPDGYASVASHLKWILLQLLY